MGHGFSRRQALSRIALAAAGTGLAGDAGTVQAADAANVTPAAQPHGACTLFPEAVEGPYYFDPKMVRSDIAEGRAGLPVDLRLKVIESGPCTAIATARVDIWHADAGGVYSGYDGQGDGRDVSTKGQTYLRGTQMTDADGQAAFRSIYPGWYPGRTPHIHVKVFLDGNTVATGQIYFADDLSARIYRDRAPYNVRSKSDTTNATDFLFKRGDFKRGDREGGGIVFAVSEAAELLTATLVIAVDRTGESAKRANGWGGFFRSIVGR